MLYIVQMIKSGTVVPPSVFNDQCCAQEAFSDLIREHCAADFKDYCDSNGAELDSFTTARDFADTLGGSVISFCFWELPFETDGVAAKQVQPPHEGKQPVLKAAAETQQQVLGVQTELRALTEKLGSLSQELIRLQNLLDDDGEATNSDEGSAAEEVPKPVSEDLDEKYLTAEWQDFVQSLIQMCGGQWGEFPLLSRHDWRQAVYSEHNALQYWEWVAITIDQSIERAKTNGYSIDEDGEQGGHFAYIAPSGERSSDLYEMEDLAWCAAGLHAAQEV